VIAQQPSDTYRKPGMPAARGSATPIAGTGKTAQTARRLLAALLLGAQWQIPAAAEEPASGPETSPTLLAADRVQASISENINGAAQWIDSFFDDERFIAEDATTKLRFGESVFLEAGDSPEYKTKINLSIHIPRTKKRLRLFIASEDDTDKTPDTLFNRVETSEDTSAAGIQFFAKATRRKNLSLTAGIKLESTELFIGPRYRLTIPIDDDWQARFTQRVRWYTSMGWESTTRLDFERLLSDRLFFRHTLDGRWREEDEGYRFEIRPTLIQKLHNGKAIEYQWNTLFKTRPKHRLESSIVRVRFRRNFLRKWLFYEANPQVAFRNDEDFEPKLGITFQLEIVFGGKDKRKGRRDGPHPAPEPETARQPAG
jgi:hypothetical protein